MNELTVVEKASEWRRMKSLVLNSVSSPITKRVYNMALDGSASAPLRKKQSSAGGCAAVSRPYSADAVHALRPATRLSPLLQGRRARHRPRSRIACAGGQFLLRPQRVTRPWRG